ncbi:hypothetical protein ZWY2020_012103 [Hordeum vulgare]|nr:hypothetical protein ZWY2020_012103 [Hordeum vulgare]
MHHPDPSLLSARIAMAGQSDLHLSLFLPFEVEFVAEDEIIEIVPNIRMEVLNMICVEFVAEDEIIEIVPNIRMEVLNMICILSGHL